MLYRQHQRRPVLTLVPYRVLDDGIYQIAANGDAGYVMDVTGHGTNEGAKVQLLKNAKADGQKFAIEYRGDGNYTVRDIHSNRYLTSMPAAS